MVESASPTGSDTPLDSTIEIIFNTDLDPATVDTATVIVQLSSTTPISGAVSYSQRKATFVPDNPLDPGARYQVVVVGGVNGVKDINGNTMSSDYNFNFETTTVEPLVAPELASPADESSITSPELSWNSVTATAEYEVQLATEPSFSTILWSTTTPDLFVSIGVSLESEKQYFWRVRAIDTDEGPWSMVRTFYYGTYNADPLQDLPPLTVKDTLPSVQQSMVDPTNVNEIKVLFNKNIDPTTVDNTTFYIVPKEVE